ncbi:hypothetical protein SFRURICE_009226 [Spodoptera frugiperda]|uniref:SFRICE_016603 n=1 Tax=Spodoptera frugiperda TaxID=7108 RepID=A0A2H1VKV5_SPOFR|nr:hypothetical protein SFRURICE_009226 [Spodoptera frugiperda]
MRLCLNDKGISLLPGAEKVQYYGHKLLVEVEQVVEVEDTEEAGKVDPDLLGARLGSIIVNSDNNLI